MCLETPAGWAATAPLCRLPRPPLGGSSPEATAAWSEERGRALNGQDWAAEARTWAGSRVHAGWPGGAAGRAMRGDTGRGPVREET